MVVYTGCGPAPTDMQTATSDCTVIGDTWPDGKVTCTCPPGKVFNVNGKQTIDLFFCVSQAIWIYFTDPYSLECVGRYIGHTCVFYYQGSSKK